MRFSALALDYDGTIAIDGALHPAVRQAIASARRLGIVVILVTGRRLDDLQRSAGDLTCFDAIVCENGAVVHFPASGRHEVLGHPPSQAVRDALDARNIPLTSGECIVESAAAEALPILEVIRALEQPLMLSFNRGRLMIVPPGVAKSTGLKHALFALRVSIHNAVGIGDAENDHDLLDACEVGVAVAWGSPALRAVADEVIQGTGPEAVAAYITRTAQQPRLSPAQMGRRRFLLGYLLDGQPVRLAVRGRTILIAGEPGTGKSWLAGLICEQLVLQGYSLCIIDPEGDYRSLEALPNVITLGGDDPPPHARELTRAMHPDVSVIIDLSKVSHARKIEYLRAALPLLADIRRRTGLPHKILLDEAHHFLCAPDNERLIDQTLEGYILVTYRISRLASAMRVPADAVVLVTRETDPAEAATLLGMCRPPATGTLHAGDFRELATDEAALLPGPDESHGGVQRFRVAPRLTSHVRHRSKYLDMRVADALAFVFVDDGRVGPRAGSLKQFIGLLASLPLPGLDQHMRRHDFSRWFDDVFRDHALAARLRSIECRAETEGTRALVDAISQAVRARYETGPSTPAG